MEIITLAIYRTTVIITIIITFFYFLLFVCHAYSSNQAPPVQIIDVWGSSLTFLGL